jgi:hypothetical protein
MSGMSNTLEMCLKGGGQMDGHTDTFSHLCWVVNFVVRMDAFCNQLRVFQMLTRRKCYNLFYRILSTAHTSGLIAKFCHLLPTGICIPRFFSTA